MQNFFETITLPLLAADFDYFRIPREKWELMLARLRQMGLEAVTLSMPWGFHEFNRGTIDLSGATQGRRAVKDLLNLCRAFDFQVILKPGPYNHQGVLGDGLPLWLLKDDDFETALPPAVEGWYKALSKTLAAQQWPDGPIVAIYLDSQPDHPQTPVSSRQLTEVKWRIWLRKRYDGLEALNQAYGTDYRTVNDVKFPLNWSQDPTPVARDAREFLEKVRTDTETRYSQTLTDAGWQIPIYPSPTEIHPHLPPLSSHSLIELQGLEKLEPAGKILNLQHPIQVDPEPVELGRGPVWANNAPIRPDGSLRQKFWAVRRFLWPQTLADISVRSQTLTLSFAGGQLVTSSSQTSLKLEIEPGAKPGVYRLRLKGELVDEERLKIRRGKLSGPYLAEDGVEQTDLILVWQDPTISLTGLPLIYLRRLLIGQAQTLARCAGLAQDLGRRLTVAPAESPDSTTPEPSTEALTTLEEARRGLSEADAALRKAIASIGGLEEGLATILGPGSPALAPQPAAAPAAISPDLFEGPARENLVQVGRTCIEIAPPLKSAADALEEIIDAPTGFTIAQYRQGYDRAVTAAQAAREPLLEVIARLRREIISESFPLVIWQIHDQTQEIAESLRWGVLRQ